MKPRLTRPEAGNKYYIRRVTGGYNPCIQGTPTYSDINTLANCVGYATGRFNEIGGYNDCIYLGNTNAENFVHYCNSQGLTLGQTPKLGACMVWEGKDKLPGHVAIVEKIKNNTEVVTSESGYKSAKIFWTQTRKKGKGNWGSGSNYKFLGFIYNPAVKDWGTGTYKLLYSKAIRRTTSLTNNIVKVKDCMESVKKELTSTKPNAAAYFKTGTIVEITEIYKDKSNRIWGKLKSCWIVLCNKDGSIQAERID